MPFKFNPLTGLLDLVNETTSGTVTGVAPTDLNAIARWDDLTATTIRNSPGTYVQDGGAIQSSGFITKRNVTTLISVPSGYSWLTPALELEPSGSIEIEPDASLVII